MRHGILLHLRLRTALLTLLLLHTFRRDRTFALLLVPLLLLLLHLLLLVPLLILSLTFIHLLLLTLSVRGRSIQPFTHARAVTVLCATLLRHYLLLAFPLLLLFSDTLCSSAGRRHGR